MSTATLNASNAVVEKSNDEAQIRGVIETLRRSHYEKDAALFARQFSADAAIFDLAPPLIHHGIDRQEKQAWFDSWSTPVDIEPRDFKVTVSGDFAFCHGYLRLSGTKKGAEGTVSFWMRETLCMERRGSGWRIVHEHSSVPFYMDGTLRPAFDLQP
jgi:ketosteroid isomerase-like protein